MYLHVLMVRLERSGASQTLRGTVRAGTNLVKTSDGLSSRIFSANFALKMPLRVLGKM